MNDDELLQQMCFDGNFTEIKKLIENGANIHVDDNYPLEISIYNNRLKIAEYLLNNGCKITDKLLYQNDLIGCLIGSRKSSIIKFLLKYVDINTMKKYISNDNYVYLDNIFNELRKEKINKIYNNKNND